MFVVAITPRLNNRRDHTMHFCRRVFRHQYQKASRSAPCCLSTGVAHGQRSADSRVTASILDSASIRHAPTRGQWTAGILAFLRAESGKMK